MKHPRILMPIAALYVETDGCYFGLPGVDPWDEARDARKYAGPYPVVAHPPCQRWGKYWAGSPLVIARTGKRLVKGDDGGCFAHALHQVRTYGGVLKHPENSHAWAHFGLNRPPERGWAADFDGGWTCRVDQGRYGHWASKPTWLYAVGVDLPILDWERVAFDPDPEVIARHGMAKARRIGQLAWKGGGSHTAVRSATPEPFRDLLLSIARSAHRARRTA